MGLLPKGKRTALLEALETLASGEAPPAKAPKVPKATKLPKAEKPPKGEKKKKKKDKDRAPKPD
jgi:hypothetical protein